MNTVQQTKLGMMQRNMNQSEIKNHSIVFFEDRVYTSLNMKAWVLRTETKEEFLKRYHVSDVDLEYYKPKRKKLEKKIKELSHYRNSGFVILNNELEKAEARLAKVNEILYSTKD